jgi:hypothetical protein
MFCEVLLSAATIRSTRQAMKKQTTNDAKPASASRIPQHLKITNGALGLIASAKACLEFECVDATTTAEGNVAPACGNTWMRICERSTPLHRKHYIPARTDHACAGDPFVPVRYASPERCQVRVSRQRRLRRIAWSLLKSRRQSSRDHLRRWFACLFASGRSDRNASFRRHIKVTK